MSSYRIPQGGRALRFLVRKYDYLPVAKGTIIEYTWKGRDNKPRTELHCWFLDDGAAKPRLVKASNLAEEDFLDD